MNKIWNIPREELLQIIENSNSILDILKVFGLTDVGASRRTLKKRLKEENINIEELQQRFKNIKIKNMKEKSIRKKIPTLEILIKNSNFRISNTNLKKRLIKEKLIPYECRCGNKGEWQGKKLTLQLEHKNGINKDNRLENLEFLCPNCHSQTKTYAGKNIRKTEDKFCLCGVKINKSSIRCKKCAKLMGGLKIENENLFKKQVEEWGYAKTGRLYKVHYSTIRRKYLNLLHFAQVA